MKGWDYSAPGGYFITVCTFGKTSFFERRDIASIVEKTWLDLPNHNVGVILDEFVIMPDHVHGIIIINPPRALTETREDRGFEKREGHGPSPTGDVKSFVGAGSKPARVSLCEVIRQFKTFSGKRINKFLDRKGPVWQRSFYDHIIRNEDDLNSIRGYIINNPLALEIKTGGSRI
ncbi:hypothetical protein DRQ36_05445 [bacterium]|nr:MAG: hypothetical protein DRQ36_05445 [bacterium]